MPIYRSTRLPDQDHPIWSGQTGATIIAYVSAAGVAKSGKVRILAVTTAERSRTHIRNTNGIRIGSSRLRPIGLERFCCAARHTGSRCRQAQRCSAPSTQATGCLCMARACLAVIRATFRRAPNHRAAANRAGWLPFASSSSLRGSLEDARPLGIFKGLQPDNTGPWPRHPACFSSSGECCARG